jgi:hypothetical protein
LTQITLNKSGNLLLSFTFLHTNTNIQINMNNS